MIAFRPSNRWPERISSPVDRQVRLREGELGLSKNPGHSSSQWLPEIAAGRNVGQIHKPRLRRSEPRADYTSGPRTLRQGFRVHGYDSMPNAVASDVNG